MIMNRNCSHIYREYTVFTLRSFKSKASVRFMKCARNWNIPPVAEKVSLIFRKAEKITLISSLIIWDLFSLKSYIYSMLIINWTSLQSKKFHLRRTQYVFPEGWFIPHLMIQDSCSSYSFSKLCNTLRTMFHIYT